jgi:hypothetical protein
MTEKTREPCRMLCRKIDKLLIGGGPENVAIGTSVAQSQPFMSRQSPRETASRVPTAVG